MRRLIINADDLGLTSGVNAAIVEAHSRGIVTSTTLMAQGRAFSDAAEKIRQFPKLSVGCHVVLVDGEPVSRPEQVSSLLAPLGRDALPFSAEREGLVRTVAATSGRPRRFYDGFGQLAVRSFRRQLRSEEVEQEVGAQIQRLQRAGVEVTHVDAHKHTHILPPVADAIMRAANACGVKAIRNPFVPIRPIVFAHVVRRPRLWIRYTEVTLLRRYHQAFRASVRQYNMRTPDGSFGVISTGSLDLDLFRAAVGCVPEGTWEFVCHPGYDDAELSSVQTRLRASREKELSVLTAPEAREILADCNIELISYRELTANH